MTATIKWYKDTVGDTTVNAVPERSGLTQPTLNRQVRAGALSYDTMAAIARAYGADVLNALMTTGLITEQDIRHHGTVATLATATDYEISQEVARRLWSHELHDPITPA